MNRLQGVGAKQAIVGSSAPRYDIAALYDAHKDAMHAVALAVLNGDRYRAEDVVMTVMEELLKRPPTKQINNMQAYMVTCAKNRARDELKRADNKTVPFEDGFDLADTASNVEADVVAWLDQRRRVQVILAALDSRERYVAVHLIAGGEPRGDVADQLGVSGSRVSQLRSEVLAKMRQIAQAEKEVM